VNIVATVAVDLERSPLGTRSRLGDDLLGRPVLRRTLERLLRCRSIRGIHVLSPSPQAGHVRDLAAGLGVRIESYPPGEPAYAPLVRTGRMWALDGWRGGVGGVCAFDEDIHVPALAALARRDGLDAIVSVPASAAVLDPLLIDGLVAHHREFGPQFRISFMQAPPGLGAVVLDRSLLEELEPTGQPPGALLAYRPSQPTGDLATKEPCYRPKTQIVEARGRLICDSRRSFERVHDLLTECGENADGATIAAWLSRREMTHVCDVPEEIELELTTTDPWQGRDLLRPFPGNGCSRGPLSAQTLECIVASIRAYDDVRIVLGGFGEPCAHPEFARIVRRLREGGAAAIAVRTSGLVDDSAIESALFETPVDILEVTLDAVTAAGYARAHGVDCFELARAGLERWIDWRSRERAVRPLIVPSFVKADITLAEMEPFFDSWTERLSMALVTGYSHCAGQRPRRAVTSMAPPDRIACRRTFSRAMVLADGCVTTCDQDFAGRQSIGNVNETPLTELWRAPLLKQIRQNAIANLPLCPACDEWHRP
jgi:hypothetical protein